MPTPHSDENAETMNRSFSGIRAPEATAAQIDSLKAVTPSTHSSRRYEVGQIIAKGGMGAILNAKEAALERIVAMKVMLNAESPDSLARFVGEAKVTGRLEHPNIVPVHELGVDDQSRAYYTMKMVHGVTLRKVLEDLAKKDAQTIAKYPLANLLTIFQKVCDAVAFAHDKGIIHRDLKPENIMIGDFGEVLVMDWGLAKILDAKAVSVDKPKPPQAKIELNENESGTQATMQGAILGTLRYMAPEQANGLIDQLDARSDIYALGGILYHMLALRTAVDGPNANSILLKVCAGEVVPPIEAINAKIKLPHLPGGRVPASLSAVAMKALALEQKDRYPNVSELQRDIAAYQNGFATSAENAGVFKQITLLIKRNKSVFATAFAAWFILTALAVWFVLSIRASERETRRQADIAKLNEQKASAEAARADGEAKRANAALAELKKSAPSLLALAESEAVAQHFESELEKIDTALALDSDLLPAYWRRAWCLVALGRFSDAAKALRVASQRDPENAKKLGAILPQIEKIAAVPDEAKRYAPEVISPVFDFLNARDIRGEAGGLIAHMRLTNDQRFAIATERLKAICGTTVGLTRLNTGLIELNFSGTKLKSLEQVRGIPCDTFRANGANIENLEPLRGLNLVEVDLASNPAIRDLSPLAGMPLRKLNLFVCSKVTDLTPLRGMPLESLTLDGTGVIDLKPLAGLPLKYINVGPASDLRPLAGMPLESLSIPGGGANIDLNLLVGMPLRTLNGTSGSNDLTPLLRIPTLERLATGTAPNALEPLRKHPTLAFINYRSKGYRPVAEFWAEFDEKNAPKK